MHQDKRLVTLLLEMVFGQDKGIFQKRQFDDKVIWILNPIPYTYKLSLKSIIELSELNGRRGFRITEQRSKITHCVLLPCCCFVVVVVVVVVSLCCQTTFRKKYPD